MVGRPGTVREGHDAGYYPDCLSMVAEWRGDASEVA